MDNWHISHRYNMTTFLWWRNMSTFLWLKKHLYQDLKNLSQHKRWFSCELFDFVHWGKFCNIKDTFKRVTGHYPRQNTCWNVSIFVSTCLNLCQFIPMIRLNVSFMLQNYSQCSDKKYSFFDWIESIYTSIDMIFFKHCTIYGNWQSTREKL